MRAASLLSIAFLGGACATTPDVTTPPPRTVSVEEVARALPDRVTKDREGWAEDIIAAIRLTKKEPTAERACAVIAVIDQESNFHSDPAVAELPRIVRTGIEAKLQPLGPLAGAARDAILEGKAPGDTRTFNQRIDKLRTERDLDRLFRDIAASFGDQVPAPIMMLGGKDKLARMNPVTTAGSMQVKVDFARELGKHEGLDDDDVRELLYTRGGGVRFGTARLLAYPASYDDVIYRFADYNAGVYASRNAAFQQMLGELTGRKLVTDGDLLAYDDDGDPTDKITNSLDAMLAFARAHELSEWLVKRDARKEKSESFEDTTIWREVREAWEAKHAGQRAPYAIVPDVALSSPKLSRPRTTSWFAGNVKKRYGACRARLP